METTKLRIVSLVPSLSETLVELGLREQLVACTKFCVRPSDLYRRAKVIGGTKDADANLIRSLQPTHILANQEENSRDLIAGLAQDIPTLVSFPKGPVDVPGMIRDIGNFLEKKNQANNLAEAIETRLSSISCIGKPKSFLYLIWQNPLMLAGPDTYISRTLELFSWKNAHQGSERYPIIDISYIESLDPDIVFLSSEPYPFRVRDAQKIQDSASKSIRFAKIDGQLLSWYGFRTLEALNRLSSETKRCWKPINLL